MMITQVIGCQRCNDEERTDVEVWMMDAGGEGTSEARRREGQGNGATARVSLDRREAKAGSTRSCIGIQIGHLFAEGEQGHQVGDAGVNGQGGILPWGCCSY